MSEQNLGQHLIIGIKGKSVNDAEANFIQKNGIGGVILFSRNIESPKQLRELCVQIQALRLKAPEKIPLLIGIDNEGGRVARVKSPFTEWPPAGQVGKLDSTSIAFKYALQMGSELRAVGINLNFAPCADVLTENKNPAIGDRSFGNDPELVAKLASATARGFIKSDIIPCLKHFPGHGNTTVDSHLELPLEAKTLAELEKCELIPFKKAMRARIDLFMTAHILYTQIDPEWPASLSEKIISKILREELRYRGLVVTDDLGMKAVAARWSPAEIAVQALLAGSDFLLFCNEPESPELAIEGMKKAAVDKKLSETVLQESKRRILAFKTAKLKNLSPQPESELKNWIGTEENQKLSLAIQSGHVPEEMLGGAGKENQ